MTGTSKNKKNLPESIIEEQLKELREWKKKIDAANKNIKEVVQLAKNNEIINSKLIHENQALKEKIQSNIRGCRGCGKKTHTGIVLDPKNRSTDKSSFNWAGKPKTLINEINIDL